MELHLFDHILTAVLVVVLPLLGGWEHRRMEAQVGAGIPNARLRGYLLIMVEEWLLAAVVICWWPAAGRSFLDLGIGFGSGLGWWTGCGLTLAAGVFLILHTVSVLSNPEKIEAVSKQIEPLRALLPHSEREGRWFAGLAATAGICEELLYRGFLLAYFTAALNLWAAVIISSIVFGLGHLYQGGSGIAKTGVVGLILAGLFLMTGSLWAPMLLHALIDLTSGFMSRRVIEYMDHPPDPPTEYN